MDTVTRADSATQTFSARFLNVRGALGVTVVKSPDMNPFRSRIALGILMAFVGFALTSTTFEAREAQGNSAAAKRCKLEWQELTTSDGQSFKNVGQCVAYAARGGVFGAADAGAVCERLGGDVTTEMRGGAEVLICSGIPNYSPVMAEAFQPYCGNVSTEMRGGEEVVICTPSGS